MFLSNLFSALLALPFIIYILFVIIVISLICSVFSMARNIRNMREMLEDQNAKIDTQNNLLVGIIRLQNANTRKDSNQEGEE